MPAACTCRTRRWSSSGASRSTPRDVEQAIVRSGARWLWAVASETSTGMLNDVALLTRLKRRYGISLCLDCVSAIGAVPVDLDGVLLASGASGKALGAFPGLSMVFYAGTSGPSRRVCRGTSIWATTRRKTACRLHIRQISSPRSTPRSRGSTTRRRTARLEELSAWFRCRLRSLGIPVLVDGPEASPAVVTIPVPRSLPTRLVGDALRKQGLLVAYQSEYLVHRNWLQVSLMGQCSEAGLERLLAALERRLGAELFAADAS